jgi:hypothetical protein
MTRDDQIELAALAGIAWERRLTPEARDAVEAIETWWDRRGIRRLERRRRSTAAVLQCLRETDPACGRRRGAMAA